MSFHRLLEHAHFACHLSGNMDLTTMFTQTRMDGWLPLDPEGQPGLLHCFIYLMAALSRLASISRRDSRCPPSMSLPTTGSP